MESTAEQIVLTAFTYQNTKGFRSALYDYSPLRYLFISEAARPLHH